MHAQSEHPLSLTGRGGAALVLIAGLAACDFTITAGDGGERTGAERFTVSVTNTGNGFGGVELAFPAGATVRDPCPRVLGPGESCSPFVLIAELPASIDVTARAEPGSRFVEWTDAHCGGTSPECTATVPGSSIDDPDLVLEPRFDLEGGG